METGWGCCCGDVLGVVAKVVWLPSFAEVVKAPPKRAPAKKEEESSEVCAIQTRL